MIRFTVHNLGEHSVENMLISGPFKEVVMSMAEMFLATYSGPPDGDLDLLFVNHVIKMAQGQGRIIEQRPAPPEDTH